MKRLIRTFLISIMLIFCIFSSLVSASALGTDDVKTKISDNNGGILSISFRGDTASYPKNSLEGIRSAEKKGADMVSVSVQRTKDGVLVLLEKGDLSALCDTAETDISNLTFKEAEKLFLKNNDGTNSKCHIISLEKALERFMPKAVLVLDNSWEFKDEIAALCKETSKEDAVILRTDASSKEIAEWKNGGGNLDVIGIYKGNIVFSVLSHLSRLSKAGANMVQFQSKNYFNVSFDNFSAKNYSAEGKARAVAVMYSKDLCGQREDNVSGWDEMVKRGFSVIETNDIEGLCRYIKNADDEREELTMLLTKAKAVDTSIYTTVSVKNLETAINDAVVCLETNNTSLGEIQSAISFLTESMNNLTIGEKTDTQRGSLNITAGKIAAVIIFGSLLLVGEIYLVKMRKKEI